MKRIVNLHIEKLPEGFYLTIRQDTNQHQNR